MPKWTTPTGNAANLCLSILKQPHLLIAGATGSGKSVIINSVIYTALYQPPTRCKLVLIDPKRVELIKYKAVPHCLAYVSEPGEMTEAIQKCVDLMESRYKAMQRRGAVKSWESDVYIVIDEFADLMTTQKRQTLPNLCRIAQLGRAANIHLILATQRPTRDIITGQIKVNMDSRIALHCPTARDSVNILDVKGAESLPRYGYGYYKTPERTELVTIPMTSESDLAARVQWWKKQETVLYRLVKEHL